MTTRVKPKSRRSQSTTAGDFGSIRTVSARSLIRRRLTEIQRAAPYCGCCACVLPRDGGRDPHCTPLRLLDRDLCARCHVAAPSAYDFSHYRSHSTCSFTSPFVAFSPSNFPSFVISSEAETSLNNCMGEQNQRSLDFTADDN